MLLNELFEAGSKHVTFCFGRMNPPTVGHKQVLDTMKKQGGDMRVFVSQSQDPKKNPLDYATKIGFIKEMFPEYANNVVEDANLNTVVKVASYLYDQGYNAATFVAGSDRLEDMKKLLTQYNGVEGKAHGYYNFEVLDFVSSGDREDGAEGVAGISASGARAAAANSDFEGFKEATGTNDKLAQDLYNAVRRGMKIAEGVNESLSNPLNKQKELEILATAHDMGDDWGEDPETAKVIGDMFDIDSQIIQQILSGDYTVSEAPIEMDPGEPMNPMIYGHDKANPAKLKYRMMRAAGQIKDLASRVDNASPAEWQTIARQFEELKMNIEQIRHALEELGKMRRKGGVRSRGIDPNIESVEESNYGRYWCSTDKKWKYRKGPKQKRSS